MMNEQSARNVSFKTTWTWLLRLELAHLTMISALKELTYNACILLSNWIHSVDAAACFESTIAVIEWVFEKLLSLPPYPSNKFVNWAFIIPTILVIRAIHIIMLLPVTPHTRPPCQWAEQGGTQICPMPFSHQRLIGPHRLWSLLQSILGMKMNMFR